MTTYRDNQVVVALLERSRALRRASTGAEQLLWHLLRARQLAGAKFRRQHQFGPYILDFYCYQARLVIELDGVQHSSAEGKTRDGERTGYLEARGMRVLRFTNLEVLGETEAVLLTIWAALKTADPSPSP